MRDILSSAGGRTQVKLSKLDQENTAIWTTERVNKLLDDFESGEIDIKTIKNSPFKDNDPAWKKGKLLFEYTPDELEEIKRCKSDPVYFAAKYAQIMTEEGIQLVPLRDYQEEIIKTFKKERFNCLMASRQIGKCFYPTTQILIQPTSPIVLQDFLKFSKISKLVNETDILTPGFELYFYLLKTRRTLSILNKIKRFLYKHLYQLDLS